MTKPIQLTSLEQLKRGYTKYGLTKTIKLSALHGVGKLKKLPHRIRKGIEKVYLHGVRLNLPNGQVIRKIQGSSMILNLHDLGISSELYLTGVHEKNSTNFIKSELKPGMTVVEIGANIGYYTLLESKIVGPTGKIIAFEPNPENFYALKLNIALNKLENQVEMYPQAVGATSGIHKFYMADKGNLSSFAKRDDQLCDYTVMDVETVALDNVLHDPFDYFRMDVEGYEWAILDGMKGILSAKNAPYGMFIELHSDLLHRFDRTAESLVQSLQKYGYEIKKAYYRGHSSPSVDSTQAFLQHPLREKGYWETFFAKK